MNSVFNHQAHIELWDWIAKNPGKSKEDWPRWDEFEEARENNHCFACVTGFGQFKCDCPLIWENEEKECIDSYYLKWYNLNRKIKLREHIYGDIQKCSILARKIRDLKVRTTKKSVFTKGSSVFIVNPGIQKAIQSAKVIDLEKFITRDVIKSVKITGSRIIYTIKFKGKNLRVEGHFVFEDFAAAKNFIIKEYKKYLEDVEKTYLELLK